MVKDDTFTLTATLWIGDWAAATQALFLALKEAALCWAFASEAIVKVVWKSIAGAGSISLILEVGLAGCT